MTSSRRPLDRDLYDAVVAEAKSRFDVWPSAYASGWVVKTYKARGGRYAGGDRKTRSGLTKWFDEEWVDLSKPLYEVKRVSGVLKPVLVGYEPCGRKTARGASKHPAAYPKCRPLKEAMRMTPDEVEDAIKRKRAAEAKAARGGRGGRGARAPVRVSTYRANPDVTSTQAFRRWFGESKVVDENGEPLVVYHGTNQGGFYTFDLGTKDNPRQGVVFFTSNYETALSYVNPAGQELDEYGLGENEDPTPPLSGDAPGKVGVYEVYLKIENPFVVDAKGAVWNEIDLNGETYSTDELARMAMKAEGFDGVIIRDVYDQGVYGQSEDNCDLFVVFDPKQIKSARRNNGTFDPDSDDIRKNPDVTRTPTFRRWFGDSKVVDENGEPLVVYHGTNKSFDVFNTRSKSVNSTTFGDVETERSGIFVSDNPEFAREFGSRLLSLYARIENLAEVNRDTAFDFAETIDAFTERDLWLLARNISRPWMLFEGELGPRFIAYLQELGHDGATFIEDVPKGDDVGEDEQEYVEGRTYVAFYPEQIKLADGTNTTFDPTNPDVRANPDDEPVVVLYHRTTPANAARIVRERRWVSREQPPFVFFSTDPYGHGTSYGEALLEVVVPEDVARLDDEFPSGEQHYAVLTRDLRGLPVRLVDE